MNDEPIPLEDEIYEEEIEVEEETSVTMAMWGEITGDIDNQTDLKEALDAKQDNLTQAQLDAVNSGINSTKVETYDGYQAQINTKASQSALEAEAEARRQADSTLQGNIDAEETARKASDKDIQDVLDGETLARQNADTALGGRIDTEIHNRQVADIGLQGQIDAITSKSDVVDVVATYADLQAYDTQHLGDNDVIKVLDDETHGDALTYYRWSKTNQTWTFIGQESPYYSKSQTDTLLLGKQNTIDSSHKLSADLVDDTSTTNKFVTASDITNWNGKQDALTAGTGIDITGGVISTPAIVPEVVTELPTTGAEGKLYLTPKAHTTSTATGNPIEATVTEQAGQLESFQLDGDTYQYSYDGGNLFNTTLENGTISSETGADSGSATNRLRTVGYIELIGGATTVTVETSSSKILQFVPRYYSEDGTYLGFGSLSWQTSPKTLNLPIRTKKMRLLFRFSDDTTMSSDQITSISITENPAPNPDYPQPIQTVTGEQTVSINGTDYSIDLGSIELCKLGTYQDYIWKDGESWKVHKATSSITLDGTEAWVYAGNYNYARCPSYTFVDKPLGGTGSGLQLSNCFGVITDWGTFRDSTSRNSFFPLLDEGYKISIRNTGCTSVEDYILWLSTNKPSFYYPVATPTDTTITDTALITQLEAIRTASLQNGANTITNTATGTNLAGDMEIGYFGFNPTNRYDKFIWLNLNNNYEQIGGE